MVEFGKMFCYMCLGLMSILGSIAIIIAALKWDGKGD